MRLICPNCDAQYEVDAAMLPPEGRDVQCSACGHVWFQDRDPQAAETTQVWARGAAPAAEDQLAEEARFLSDDDLDEPAPASPIEWQAAWDRELGRSPAPGGQPPAADGPDAQILAAVARAALTAGPAEARPAADPRLATGFPGAGSQGYEDELEDLTAAVEAREARSAADPSAADAPGPDLPGPITPSPITPAAGHGSPQPQDLPEAPVSRTGAAAERARSALDAAFATPPPDSAALRKPASAAPRPAPAPEAAPWPPTAPWTEAPPDPAPEHAPAPAAISSTLDAGWGAAAPQGMQPADPWPPEPAPDALPVAPPAAARPGPAADPADLHPAFRPDPPLRARVEAEDEEEAPPELPPGAEDDLLLRRPKLDDDKLALLREEAERETRARAVESARAAGRGLEMQPDLGLPETEPPVRLHIGPRVSLPDPEELEAPPAAGQTPPRGPRRELLPDIERINRTLASSGAARGGKAELPPLEATTAQRKGFRRGFLLSLGISLLLALTYLNAGPIGETVPALQHVLTGYTALVDALRLELDQLLRQLLDSQRL